MVVAVEELSPAVEADVKSVPGQHLVPFLDLVRFPAAPWEILIAAEEYGADVRTRTALLTLPHRSYADRQAVIREIAQRARGREGTAVEQVARPPRARARRRPWPAA